MTDLQLVRLSSALLPTEWSEHLFGDQKTAASPIFCVDVFRNASQEIEVIVRPESHQDSFYGGLEFSLDDGKVQPRDLFPTPRGARLTFPDHPFDHLKVRGFGAELDFSIEPDLSAVFEGSNVLFTLAIEPQAQTIADWIRFHRGTQGATAALIFIRSRLDFDKDAFDQSLRLLAKEHSLGTIRIVHCDIPLGHPDMPSETSRHQAPDAPGKALLPNPTPDPWTSPVVELTILEVARRRFLAKARAVLFCQPYDLVEPPKDRSSTVFDVCFDGSGFVKFHGKRAYPYALDGEGATTHGHHNCISFDGKRSENIWCAAPQKLEPNTFWRQFRVTGNVQSDDNSEFTYWRCMALKHPDLKVGELVPKSSLIAAPELSEILRPHFELNPKSPPSPPKRKKETLKNDKVLIVTTMKNEGPFILEWLAYHRSIGVSDFLVYTNDCSDGTDEMFDLLKSKGLLEHRENPYRDLNMKPQHAAYQAASETDLASSADWVIPMDVDEYINIHVGDGTLSSLFKAVPDATLISLTWRLFGNGDISSFSDRPIIEQFDQCAPVLCRKPHQAWGFKTMFRNLGHYKKFGVHRPKGLKPEYIDHINWVNGSGVQMPAKMLRTGWRSSTSTIGYDLVSLNHYSLRSAESFLVKRDRGRVNHVDRDQGLAYWFRMNHNAERNTSIANKLPAFRKELSRLMADPEILEMHNRCVAAHRARISELMEAPDYKNLYDEITGERLRSLSRMLHHFGNQEFLDGPDAVPQDFHKTQKQA